MAGASASSTGVYMGCVWQEYPALTDALRVPSSAHVLTGSGMNFMVGRVSYTFGWQGEHLGRLPSLVFVKIVCCTSEHGACSCSIHRGWSPVAQMMYESWDWDSAGLSAGMPL